MLDRLGFSTGALSLADFQRGLEISRELELGVVELSALREQELPDLMHAIDLLDLSAFNYVSIHAPSSFDRMSESEAIDLLSVAANKRLPIILHPDAVQNLQDWAQFGELLCIENMDKRKRRGRTVAEMHDVFLEVPQASMCFDLAHARQVDPTMSQAVAMARRFGSRIRQLHLSEVDNRSRHTRLTMAAHFAYPEVLGMLSQEIPVILETPVTRLEAENELKMASSLLQINGARLEKERSA